MYWQSGLEVIRSGHFPGCNPLCIQLVWRELFELSWFHSNCNPKYTKTIMVLISKACIEWCWSTEEQNWYLLQSSKLQVKAEFTLTCPLACCPAILSFQTGMDTTLVNYMCLGVRRLLQSLQWCASVGCNSQSYSSDIPIGAVSTKFFPMVFQFTLQILAGWPSGIPVYTGSTSDIPVASQFTLDQPVYTGSG